MLLINSSKHLINGYKKLPMAEKHENMDPKQNSETRTIVKIQ